MSSESFTDYLKRGELITAEFDWRPVEALARDLRECWRAGKHFFLCGNGGSAANANHLANDYLYGIAGDTEKGLRACALSANSSVLTCLGNDVGYENVFSAQLKVLAQSGDLLLVLSGSGNSPNVVNALTMAKELGVKSYAILGYSGGKCKDLADVAIHFPIDDMQIAEDLQLTVGHMVMQWLQKNRPAAFDKQ